MSDRDFGQFEVLSDYYDRFNGADYNAYSEYIEKAMSVYGMTDGKLILDLACGTGKLTSELSRRGYDMIGADISVEMLMRAKENAMADGLDILYLCQDMRDFELYGTVDAVVCALDGVNYLQKREDVLKCFKLVRNYLNPGALFLFDVNSEYRFKEVFAKRDYFLEDGGVYLGWHSEYHQKSGKCDLFLTLFIEDGEGRYIKREEMQTEKLWKDDELCRIIDEAGLEKLAVFSGFDMKNAEENDEKRYYVCRCPIEK